MHISPRGDHGVLRYMFDHSLGGRHRYRSHGLCAKLLPLLSASGDPGAAAGRWHKAVSHFRHSRSGKTVSGDECRGGLTSEHWSMSGGCRAVLVPVAGRSQVCSAVCGSACAPQPRLPGGGQLCSPLRSQAAALPPGAEQHSRPVPQLRGFLSGGETALESPMVPPSTASLPRPEGHRFCPPVQARLWWSRLWGPLVLRLLSWMQFGWGRCKGFAGKPG